MKKMKKMKGITLIALVVTIVVLLILATVSMSGIEDEGIIEQADTAKSQVEKLQARQKVETVLTEINIKKNIYGSTTDITQKFDNIQTITAGSKYKVTEDGFEFIIQGNNGEYEIVEYELKWLTQNNPDGTISITGFDVSEFLENEDYVVDGEEPALKLDLGVETIIVPSTYDGLTVTSFSLDDTLWQIWNKWEDGGIGETFLNIKKIVLPDTIKETTFSQLAFLPDLEEIILPSELEVLNIVRPDIIDDERPFWKIESLSIPNTVISITNYNAFVGLEVNFPNGINDALTIPDDLWGATSITVTENGTTTTYPTSN